MKLLCMTLATAACLLSLTAGCGGNATGPDPVREPPPEPRGLLAPRMGGTAVINGRVVDFDTGQRLAGVKVDALDQNNSPHASVTTDAAGGFRMEVRAGLVRFRVSAACCHSYDRNHFLEAGTKTMEIAMRNLNAPV